MRRAATLALVETFFAAGLVFIAWSGTTTAEPAPEEPTPDVIRSGTCRIPVCTSIDFGDYFFRYYAPDRSILIRFIPKGACQCGSIHSGNANFNGTVVLSVETPDGRTMHSVSVLRIWPSGHPRARPERTTYEEFLSEEKYLDELSDFHWKDDHFSAFRVFRARQIYALGARRYSFVPKAAQFHFRGESQPIVFTTPLARRLDDEAFEADGPKVAAQVRLSETVQFFQFFVPRLIPSDGWIAAMERTAEMIDTRLMPKRR
jgi:hypothetical protein